MNQRDREDIARARLKMLVESRGRAGPVFQIARIWPNPAELVRDVAIVLDALDKAQKEKTP